MLVQQGDDGFDMSFFDDVQGFRTLHQYTVQHLQDPCSANFYFFSSSTDTTIGTAQKIKFSPNPSIIQKLDQLVNDWSKSTLCIVYSLKGV